MPQFFAKADVLLLALKDEPIFRLTVPAKLQAYMSAGKPIVAMMNGEGADTVSEAGCGWSVEAENSFALAQCIRKASKLSKSELQYLGDKGKKFSELHYSLANGMNHLSEMLVSMQDS